MKARLLSLLETLKLALSAAIVIPLLAVFSPWVQMWLLLLRTPDLTLKVGGRGTEEVAYQVRDKKVDVGSTGLPWELKVLLGPTDVDLRPSPYASRKPTTPIDFCFLSSSSAKLRWRTWGRLCPNLRRTSRVRFGSISTRDSGTYLVEGPQSRIAPAVQHRAPFARCSTE
jgi:hypothetical protein